MAANTKQSGQTPETMTTSTIYETYDDAVARRRLIGTPETHTIVMRYDGYEVRERMQSGDMQGRPE